MLLQVLWLMAEDSNQQQQESGEVSWLKVLSACHMKVLYAVVREPDALNTLCEFMGPHPLICLSAASGHTALRALFIVCGFRVRVL